MLSPPRYARVWHSGIKIPVEEIRLWLVKYKFLIVKLWLVYHSHHASIKIRHSEFTRSDSYKNWRRPDWWAPFYFTVDRTNINSRRARCLDATNQMDSIKIYFDLNIENQEKVKKISQPWLQKIQLVTSMLQILEFQLFSTI